MSFERPSEGLLVFQCDVCFDTFEIGDDVDNFRACWSRLRKDGWSMSTSEKGTAEHLCSDCTQTAKADRANPFRR